jgi:hypothetical protein
MIALHGISKIFGTGREKTRDAFYEGARSESRSRFVVRLRDAPWRRRLVRTFYGRRTRRFLKARDAVDE